MKQIANHRPTATPRLRADGNKYFSATRDPRPPINFILAPASRDLGPIIGRSDNKVPVSTIHSSSSDQIKRPNLEDWWSQSRDPARNCHWPFSRHVTGTVTLKFDFLKKLKSWPTRTAEWKWPVVVLLVHRIRPHGQLPSNGPPRPWKAF